MIDAGVLACVLARPIEAQALDEVGWTALLTIGRAEQLIGTLAARLAGLAVPGAVAAVLADARAGADHARRTALWEAEMVRRALAPLGCPVVLLKGTAYAAAGLAAGRGRAIGDLDILVPRDRFDAVARALLGAGWEWVTPDPYDDDYYRRWMHELPPLIHRDRDRMIDVHHTILPLTAGPTPDAAALVADAVALGNGLSVLAPADMIVHAAAHLLAAGDLAGGLRNLWDIHCLGRRVRHGRAGGARGSSRRPDRDDARRALGARAVRHRRARALARSRPAGPAVSPSSARPRWLGPTNSAGDAPRLLRPLARAAAAAGAAGATPVDQVAARRSSVGSSSS